MHPIRSLFTPRLSTLRAVNSTITYYALGDHRGGCCESKIERITRTAEYQDTVVGVD